MDFRYDVCYGRTAFMGTASRPADRVLLYLIDASSYVFRAFHAVPPLTSSKGVPTNAIYGVTNMFLKLLREAVPRHAVAVFDAPGPTFRDTLYPAYKANRPRPADELIAQLPFIRRIVSALGLVVREEAGVEADDVIGTLTRRAVDAGASVVIVTGDKDLAQIVGERVSLWDTMRDRRTRLEDIRERFGVDPPRLVDIMGLMGDATDNIPGVRGIGEKTATALVRHFGGLDSVLEHADAEAVARAGVRGAAKIAAALAREAETARLSRDLATIRCDLPLEFSIDACSYTGPRRQPLAALLTELEFSSLLRDLMQQPEPVDVRQTVVDTPESVDAFVRRVGRAGSVALAFSMTGSRAMQAGLSGIAFASGEGVPTAVTVPSAADTAAVVRSLAPLLENPAVEKVGDDLKSLIVIAGRHDVRVSGPQFDTRIASYLLNPTQEGHDVVALARRMLGLTLEANTPRGVGAVAAAIERLRSELERPLIEYDAMPLFRDVEMPLVGILADMERHGVNVDTDRLQALSIEYAGRLERLLSEAHELAGGGFNLHSPAQLRRVLFERLRLPTRGVRRGKTGLSTDVDVLKRLARQHPLPGLILEYRALSKLKSTYIDALPALVHAETGRIHTTFHQTVTATGRLSSSDPNLQNIPVRGEEGRRIRAAFTAPAGRMLVSADYSQIELRILAHLSGDPALIDAFGRGEDVHARTAAEVFGGLSGVSDEMRRAAKAINFGIIYGMGATRLARELDVAQEEASRYIRLYFERYAGVKSFFERTVAAARGCGYVTTLLNRRRYLPDLGARTGAARQFAERMAINTPIQGSAADLIKVAMLRVHDRIERDGLPAVMVLQVHDELVFEVEREQVDVVTEVVRAEMEGVAKLAVPLRVDVRAGENWAEAH